jgi:hypothetical protein
MHGPTCIFWANLTPFSLQAYLFVHRQPRSAWTFEMQLRPWGETW